MFGADIFIAFVVKFVFTGATFSTDGCGKDQNCWFHPPGCQTVHVDTCHGSVKWSVRENGVNFQLEATTNDLDPNKAVYVALGISKDMYMGDDSVIECIIAMDGVGKAYVSFNDETNNEQLYQASEMMLTNVKSFLEDGHMICNVTWIFEAREKVEEKDRFKVFDLTLQPWHFLFAKGSADKRSLQKEIHSVNDGPLFPWITTEQIRLYPENSTATGEDDCVIISNMKQTDMSRYWRYRFAIIHGVFMVLAWWVFISSIILIARFFKPIWSRQKIFGTAVWFQIHRNLALIAICLNTVGIFLIIFQAGRLYQCSYKCSLEDWTKKMHVITGIAATVLMLIQPFLGMIRPGPNSRLRPVFSWIHWFIGMAAWTFATVTIFLSVPLGKTGLLRVYGYLLTWIFIGYVIVFLMSNIILEIFSYNSERNFDKFGSSTMVLGFINGPSNESPLTKATFPFIRLSIFFVHGVVALGVTIILTVMLITILHSHSP